MSDLTTGDVRHVATAKFAHRLTGPEFDAWLNTIKAEAWAEGYHSLSGLKFAVNQFLDNGGFAGVGIVDALDEAEEAKNPYREEAADGPAS